MNVARGSERASRPFVPPGTSEEEYRPVCPEPRRSAVNVPRELPPGASQDVDSWVENYRRNEARWLDVRVQELERQLRRRTMVLGSGLVLLTGAATGAIVVILLSLPSLHQRTQLAASSSAERPVLATPAEVGVTLPVPLVVAAQPAKRAGNPGPMVQPPSPEQIPGHVHRAEPSAVTSAPEHGSIEPVARRIEWRHAQPVPTAETRAALPLSPPLPLPADDPADIAATTPMLRAVLSDIKRQMRVPLEAGHLRATGRMPPGFERAEPPLVALTAREPPDEARPLPMSRSR